MGTRNDGHDRRPCDCRENVGYTLELTILCKSRVIFSETFGRGMVVNYFIKRNSIFLCAINNFHYT